MQGVAPEDPEESFRRGYEHAAIETFHAIERFLDPSTREVLRTWIEEDIYVWRHHAARQRGGVAARDAGAAYGDTGGRLLRQQVAYRIL
jgi:hypothetical protein